MSTRFIALAVAVVVLLFAATTAPAVVAQQPPGACTVPVAQAEGGETVRLSTIEFSLPAGYSYQWGIFAVSGSAHVRVCVKELGSEVTLNMQTAEETSRIVTNAAAAPILDQIAASAGVIPLPGATRTANLDFAGTPTATPAPQVATQPAQSAGGGAGSSTITPPNTGGVGLAR